MVMGWLSDGENDMGDSPLGFYLDYEPTAEDMEDLRAALDVLARPDEVPMDVMQSASATVRDFVSSHPGHETVLHHERDKRVTLVTEVAEELLALIGTEPAEGTVVSFTKQFTRDGARYRYAALRTEDRWYATGGLVIPLNWVGLNEFADPGSIRVATTWQELPTPASNDRVDAR